RRSTMLCSIALICTASATLICDLSLAPPQPRSNSGEEIAEMGQNLPTPTGGKRRGDPISSAAHPPGMCADRTTYTSSALLLQIDGLVMPGLVELCTPHLVHTLVIGPAEDHGRAEPNVEVMQIFQSPD